MDPFLARTMVESLSKGINPVTGRPVPYGDSCYDEEIQDALLEVLMHCTIESNEQYLIRVREEKKEKAKQKREETLERFPRSGETWEAEEDKELLQLYRKVYNIYQISHILKRTPKAISSRLAKMYSIPVHRSK